MPWLFQPIAAVPRTVVLEKDPFFQRSGSDQEYPLPSPCVPKFLYSGRSAVFQCFHTLSIHRSGDTPGTQSRCIACTKPIAVFLLVYVPIHAGNDILLH